MRFQLDDDRLHQELGRRRATAPLCLQLFVEHTLVRGMHVHEDETRTVLRDDVDAVELGNRDTERLFVLGFRLTVSPAVRDEGRTGVLLPHGLGDSPWAAAFLAPVECALPR